MVRVSKETLKLLEDYKEEFGARSLDSAIKNSVQWARLWNYVEYKTRKDLTERVSNLEFRIEAIERQNKT